MPRPQTSRRLWWFRIVFLLALIVGTVFILREANSPIPYQHAEGQIFGTQYHITYSSRKVLDRQILQALKQVDESMSLFNPQSTLSRINANQSAETDTLLRQVFRVAQAVSEATYGCFDVTVAPLVNAWGFGSKARQAVDETLLDSLMPLVGWRKVSLDGTALRKQHPGTQLDFGAIAKGFSCDHVARALEDAGVENYMIEIGGEMRLRGVNAEGRTWTIGITQPNDDACANPDAPLQTILARTDCGIATSGNYRNFYYGDSGKVAHTIDPRTGRPIQQRTLSATVIAPTCAEADALATAFMVMPLEQAQQLVRQRALEVYLIYATDTGALAVWQNPENPSE